MIQVKATFCSSKPYIHALRPFSSLRQARLVSLSCSVASVISIRRMAASNLACQRTSHVRELIL